MQSDSTRWYDGRYVLAWDDGGELCSGLGLKPQSLHAHSCLLHSYQHQRRACATAPATTSRLAPGHMLSCSVSR
jgi:hypothetical protein